MMTDNCGITPVYNVDGNNRNYDGFGDGGWVWIIFLFFLMAWGGNSWGNGFGGAGAQSALTRDQLCEDMNFQSMENAVRGIQQGLCDGFYAQNTTMLQGFSGVDAALCNGFNNVNNNITQSRFDAQQCCCETNRNIDAVRYENSRNTCDIIQASNANTQRIIDHLTSNEIQTLRDNLQAANFQLSQQAQSANLINQLRPCPIPAYLSCSPYTSFDPYARNGAYGNCGCGCGC